LTEKGTRKLPKIIYTIGTSTREIEEFLELLKTHHIEILVDVRSFPTSKFDQFKKENLKKAVEGAGLEYFYLGDLLGGFRSGGYQTFTETETFQKGLRKLEELACEKVVAFCCCERFPWRCHRRFISARLQDSGWQVIHIIDKGCIWVPKRKMAKETQKCLL